MMKTKTYYASNLTIYDLDNALRNDSISARDSLEEIIKEDLTLYTKAELKKQRYFKLTLEEIKKDA